MERAKFWAYASLFILGSLLLLWGSATDPTPSFFLGLSLSLVGLTLIAKDKGHSPAQGLLAVLSPGVGLLAIMMAFASAALSAETEVPASTLLVDRITLVKHGRTFALKDATVPEAKPVVIPRKWLIPQAEEQDAEGVPVNSFAYEPTVTAFPIGNRQLGLHISSYDAMVQGSLQAAAGRDAFLIYDPGTKQVRPGLVTLGVTKDRGRFLGCMSARTTHFVVGDIDRDGLTDIGIVKEQIVCEEYPSQERDVEPGRQPRYRQDKIQWFVFDRDQWRLRPQYEGVFLDQAVELPLIGMNFSPVDFVKCRPVLIPIPTAPKAVVPEGPFVPAYRQKLIERGTPCG
jgi:hypothetical protein